MKVDQFRAELRAWLDEHDLTPGPDHSLEGHVKQLARVHSALYDAGWMRYGWPVHVGGLGGPAMLRAIVGEEVVGRRLAEPGPYSMVEVLAPTMIDYAPAELAAEMVRSGRMVMPGVSRSTKNAVIPSWPGAVRVSRTQRVEYCA
jgi:alkylation response protein AidB-like acyl-CoA dehydrogenase